jgi:hypothetical protein
VDLEEARERVLGVRQLERQLQLARPGPDLEERLVGVLLDRLAGAEELEVDLQLVGLLLQSTIVGKDLVDALQLPEGVLRGGRVRPEAGVAALRLELFLLSLRPGDVKDSRGGR